VLSGVHLRLQLDWAMSPAIHSLFLPASTRNHLKAGGIRS
jgi:hypothetical protein